MEEQKVNKISLSTVLLMCAIIIIIIMVFFIFKLNEQKNAEIKKYNDLQSEISTLNNLINNLQSQIVNTSETVNSESSTTQQNSSNEAIVEQTTTSTSNSDDIQYEIIKKENQYGDVVTAIITATKDGNTVTREIETDALIADTGTMVLPTIGSVALVADSGGEYYGINIYQLVNGKIEKLGTIDCGADMVEEATYSVETKDESKVVITAYRNEETITKEFEMSAAVDETEVVDILECGKVVLVAETGGEYYALKVFRLSQDYTNGKTNDIIEVGSIQYLF